MFFILCMKTAVLSRFSYIHWVFHKTQKVLWNRKICSYYVIILKHVFGDCLSFVSKFAANLSPSDQRCFNVVDQRWNNVDPTLKMKRNPTSDFQRCTTLMQRQCPTLKQRQNNITQRQSNVAQRWYNVDTTFHPSVDVI